MHRTVTSRAISAFKCFQCALDVCVAAALSLVWGLQALDQPGIKQRITLDLKAFDADKFGIA